MKGILTPIIAAGVTVVAAALILTHGKADVGIGSTVFRGAAGLVQAADLQPITAFGVGGHLGR